jgi:hypothetical protein
MPRFASVEELFNHRRVKQRLRPMLGLKSIRTAAIVIGGIELRITLNLKMKPIQSGRASDLHQSRRRDLADCLVFGHILRSDARGEASLRDAHAGNAHSGMSG